jgi:hypothetical protein
MLEPPGFLMLNYGVQTPREPRRPHCLRVASPRWATEILATAGCFTGTEVIACLATDMELVDDCCERVAGALDAGRSIAFQARDRGSPAHKSGSSTVTRVPAAGSDSKPNAPSWDAHTHPNESEAVTGDLRSGRNSGRCLRRLGRVPPPRARQSTPGSAQHWPIAFLGEPPGNVRPHPAGSSGRPAAAPRISLPDA